MHPTLCPRKAGAGFWCLWCQQDTLTAPTWHPGDRARLHSVDFQLYLSSWTIVTGDDGPSLQVTSLGPHENRLGGSGAVNRAAPPSQGCSSSLPHESLHILPLLFWVLRPGAPEQGTAEFTGRLVLENPRQKDTANHL